MKDKCEESVQPKCSEAVERLKEYLGENEENDEIEIGLDEGKNTLKTDISKKIKNVTIKGYATYSKEICQPSAWDVEEPIVKTIVLTKPLEGNNNNLCIEEKEPGDENSNSEKVETTEKIDSNYDQNTNNKLDEDQLKNFSKLDLLILEKLRNTFDGFNIEKDNDSQSYQKQKQQHKRKVNISKDKSIDNSPKCDLKEECNHISNLINAFIEKSTEKDTIKYSRMSPEKMTNNSECNTKTADTEERKRDDSIGYSNPEIGLLEIGNIKKKQSLENPSIEKNNDVKIDKNKNVIGSANKSSTEIGSIDNTCKDRNMSLDKDEKKEYKLFNKNYSQIRRYRIDQIKNNRQSYILC